MAGKPTRRSTGHAPTQSPPAQGGYLKRGQAAMQRAWEEAERSASGKGDRAPWRFWLANSTEIAEDTVCEAFPQGIPKNECGIIMLDETLDDVVGMYEHNLEIAGKFGNHEGCPKEWAACPLCDAGNKSYYVVFFSILALKPWSSKDGTKSGMATRMLLPVKSAQLATFQDNCLRAQKANNGRLRGTYFYMKRDTTNEQSANIGVPVVLDDGRIFDFYTEAELADNYGHEAILSPEGKVLKAENDDIKPFDYDAIFKRPDEADLRRRYGGAPVAGSAEETAQTFGAPARSAPRRRPQGSAAQAGAPPSEQEEDNDNLPF